MKSMHSTISCFGSGENDLAKVWLISSVADSWTLLHIKDTVSHVLAAVDTTYRQVKMRSQQLPAGGCGLIPVQCRSGIPIQCPVIHQLQLQVASAILTWSLYCCWEQ